jgi:hypothetical protein
VRQEAALSLYALAGEAPKAAAAGLRRLAAGDPDEDIRALSAAALAGRRITRR